MPRWTNDAKQVQRDRIKQTRPWLHSTGPRSIYGKTISRLNAAKPHKRQTLSEPRQFQLGHCVRYIGDFQPTFDVCGGQPLKVVGFDEAAGAICASQQRFAIACRTPGGKLIWIYAKDLQDAEVDR